MARTPSFFLTLAVLALSVSAVPLITERQVLESDFAPLEPGFAPTEPSQAPVEPSLASPEPSFAPTESIEPSIAPIEPSLPPTETAEPSAAPIAPSGLPGVSATTPTPVPSANPSPSHEVPHFFNKDGQKNETKPKPSPACFPASAQVAMADGSTKAMKDLAVGDRTLHGGEVLMFTHKVADVSARFIELSTESGAHLRLTSGHYLPLNGAYAPARNAKVGDLVTLADGSVSRVARVNEVADIGLYNPQTMRGDIVVDGVRASTYTEAVEPVMAHALLAPLRAACRGLGVHTALLEKGADNAVHVLSTLG